jgi:hypothetical protein
MHQRLHELSVQVARMTAALAIETVHGEDPTDLSSPE